MKPEPFPQAGGSYTRDEKTGELIKNAPIDTPQPPPDTPPAAPAKPKKEQ